MAAELSNATRFVLEVVRVNPELPQSEILINRGESLHTRLCVNIATHPQAVTNTYDVVRRLPDLMDDFADWYDRLRTSWRNLKETVCEGRPPRRRSGTGSRSLENGAMVQWGGGLPMGMFDQCEEIGSDGGAKLGPHKNKKRLVKGLQKLEKALRKLKAALPVSNVSM